MPVLLVLIFLLATVIPGSIIAQPLDLSGPTDYHWFGDSLAAITSTTVNWTGDLPGHARLSCRLTISPELSASYSIASNGSRVDLCGRDKLGLTYACLDFLDSVRVYHLGALTESFTPRDFTPRTTARIVMLTQRPGDAWPKARNQLLNAVEYGRATEVIIAGFPKVWQPREVWEVDSMLTLCDHFGLQARLLTATFSKWYFGAVPTDRCLCSAIPLRLRRNTPDPQRLLDRSLYAFRPIVASSSDSDRVFLPVTFPRADDTFRLWAVTYTLRADPTTPRVHGNFMWYRNDRYADPKTEGIQVWHQLGFSTAAQTFQDTVTSLEELHWIAHFQCTNGRMWLDSVRVVEVNPYPHEVVPCTSDTLPSGWYRFQKDSSSAYLSALNLRPEMQGSADAVARTMDSCFVHFHHHPSLIGFFSSCDEVYIMGWDPLFIRTYANAGQGYVDLLRKIANKAHSLFPSSRLLFYGDMMDPYQNAKVYTRSCNPRGGGFKDSRFYAEPDTSKLDILLWGEDSPSIIRSLVKTFSPGWTWTAGITIPFRAKEDAAWQPVHPSRVCYFSWGDQFYTPAVLSDLKNHWYK